MPTYDYSGETTKKFNKILVKPGKRFEIGEYISDSDCNLVSDLPSAGDQMENFFNDDIVAGTTTEVEINPKYKRIVAYNICGGVCKIYPNDDTDKAIPIENNSFWTFDNRDQKIGKLCLSGEYSGRVRINADMNTIGS